MVVRRLVPEIRKDGKDKLIMSSSSIHIKGAVGGKFKERVMGKIRLRSTAVSEWTHKIRVVVGVERGVTQTKVR